ncbi:hypothetical protein RCOM_0542680 [Ricinus communis]|uniref:Interferon-related developmental regulator N-terminal domain-containing protein n=1 Tax=Ricinus communis TaxID=3988 RepID=B9SKN4_RICCO|nr:hypothetical protein RCOM_0542680 [Ricinus communis]
MIVEYEDYAHEKFQNSLHVLEKALESGSKKFKVLDSLAIVTFFAANNVEETEKAYDKLASGISARSFLLSTIEGWKINHKHWQGAISYMSNLLDEDDDCIYVAAAEALALTFETDCILN